MRYQFDYDFEREERKKTISNVFFAILRWFLEITVVVFIAYILVVYTVEQTNVIGNSMEPTMSDGESIIINKLAFIKDKPQRYDLVVFRQGGEEHMYYNIKRVIGLPGEQIWIQDGEIYIRAANQLEFEMLLEPYIVDPIQLAGFAVEPITLEEDEYFVLGDNRNSSEDSRFSNIGNVVFDDIVGLAWLRVHPFSFINQTNKDYVRPTPTPVSIN